MARKPKRARLSGRQSGDSAVAGDDAVGFEANDLRMGLAVETKGTQTIATRRVAGSPAVKIGRRRVRPAHPSEEARGRRLRHEDDVLVVVGVNKLDHRLSAVSTSLGQAGECLMR